MTPTIHPAPNCDGYVLRDERGNVVRGDDLMPLLFSTEDEAQRFLDATRDATCLD